MLITINDMMAGEHKIATILNTDLIASVDKLNGTDDSFVFRSGNGTSLAVYCYKNNSIGHYGRGPDSGHFLTDSPKHLEGIFHFLHCISR